MWSLPKEDRPVPTRTMRIHGERVFLRKASDSEYTLCAHPDSAEPSGALLIANGNNELVRRMDAEGVVWLVLRVMPDYGWPIQRWKKEFPERGQLKFSGETVIVEVEVPLTPIARDDD